MGHMPRFLTEKMKYMLQNTRGGGVAMHWELKTLKSLMKRYEMTDTQSPIFYMTLKIYTIQLYLG